MAFPVKKIAILTSGGDCAGLNAALRAIVLRASSLDWEVIGIMAGTHGLVSRPPQVRKLTPNTVDSFIMRQGGTILGTTNKGNPFSYPMPDGSVKDLSDEIIAGYHSLNCDALIAIGGDGSLDIINRLATRGGFPVIGIPKTIDNDVALTETAIGFDTAVAVATEALDRLQPTAASHDRIMILEVMGRDAGHIALTAGIAGGADVILIPEIPYDIHTVVQHIGNLRQNGRNFALIVISEAVRDAAGASVMNEFFGKQKRLGGIGQLIGAQIAELCGAETRVTVLGHVQRGGAPSAQDRLLATAFGVHAVELILQGRFNRMVAWQNREVVDVAIADAIKTSHLVNVDGALIKTARGLGICLGDSAPRPLQ